MQALNLLRKISITSPSKLFRNFGSDNQVAFTQPNAVYPLKTSWAKKEERVVSCAHPSTRIHGRRRGVVYRWLATFHAKLLTLERAVSTRLEGCEYCLRALKLQTRGRLVPSRYDLRDQFAPPRHAGS